MTTKTTKDQESVAIAIVGMGGLFPGAVDVAAFWQNVVRGIDLVTDVPDSHFKLEDYFDADPKIADKTYCRRGAFLPEVPFDTLANGIPPSMLSSTDTSQLLGLLVARTTLEDCFDGKLEAADRSRVSVLLGATSGQELFGQMASRLQRPAWEAGMRAAGIPEAEVQAACAKISACFAPWTEATFPGLLGNVIAGRIANRLDTGGTNAVTDAACASSFAAIAMGIDELVLGRADVVLSGGVDTMNDIFMYMCFSKTPALSASGRCRPFDKSADGTLLGEGLGMVALKRLADAERDGNKIYAVIRGVGTSSDGRAKSVYAPVPEGQAKALRRAYEAAGYSASTVELVEAHGTGTRAGDAAELEGLRIAFEESGRKDRQWCAVGSVKSQIGHTKSAAGAAGLLKAALSLHQKVIPPTLHVTEPNPAIDFAASPFYIATEARPWIRPATDHPRRASVSSFGFGGSNFHLTLEEYVGAGRKAPRLAASPGFVLLAAGGDAATLATSVAAVESDLAGGMTLAEAAGAAIDRYPAGAHVDGRRVAFVATTEDDARALLAKARAAVTAGTAMPPGIFAGAGAVAGDVAFVFPGQGSQSLGMGGALAMAFDEARSAFDEADGFALAETPLSRIIFPPSTFDAAARATQSATLTATEWAQPALGAASVASLRVLALFGVVPAMVAGHSFGELVALHAAGSLDFASLMKLARKRGELMAAASGTPGAMLAAVTSAELAESAIARVGVVGKVVVANHNAPDQVVLSGERDAIDAVARALDEAKVTTKRLAVSTAFHSPLVADATAPLRAFLATIDVKAPTIAVFANTTASRYEGDADALRNVVAEQVARPVRFVDEVRAMYDAGARVFVEVGPGAVLTPLVARILGDKAVAFATDAPKKDGALAMLACLARLVAVGAGVDVTKLPRSAEPAKAKAAPSKSRVGLRGVNYGKPAFPAPMPAQPRAPVLAPAPAPTMQAAATVSPKDARTMTTRTNDSRGYTNGANGHAVAAPATVPTQQHAAPTAVPAAAGWLDVFREGQRQTAESHAAFQKAMTDAHLAYLQASEATSTALAALLAGHAPTLTIAAHAAPRPALAAAPPAPAAYVPPPAPAPAHAPPAVQVASARMPAPVAPAPPRAAPPAIDAAALLLAVVSEKTGYPVEALAPEMSLEADLGIDSIKRVEILGAFKERMPDGIELDPLKLAQLATLGDIAKALTPAGARVPATAPAAAAASSQVDAAEVFLAIVAEKTGYPRDALALEMSLEADLGIDSIKRVEILGAFKERVPVAPEIDPLKLAQLATLGEIARALSPASATTTTSAPAKIASEPPATQREPSPHARRETPLSPMKAAPKATMAQRGVLRIQEIPQRARRPFAPPAGRVIIVVDDGRGVASAVAALLEDRGMHAVVLARGDQPERGVAVGGLVDVSALGDVASSDDAVAHLKDALVTVRGVASDLRGAPGAFFLAAFDTGGDFGTTRVDAVRAITGGLAGLVKTAALEWPTVACKALDIDLTGMAALDAARIVIDELASGFDGVEVGRRGAHRVEPIVVTEALAATGQSLVSPRSVIVASGGARGVTATTLRALARACKPRIVLLGRTDIVAAEPASCAEIAEEAKLKPALIAVAKAEGRALSLVEIGQWAARIVAAREIRAFLGELEGLGAKAIYVATDIRDEKSVAAAVAEGRRAFGPITGIVHGAGVLADKRIEDKTREQVDRVVDTKVRGLRALLDATASDPLDLLCAFSSVAGRFGNVGQVDYAMANEAMSKMLQAEQQRRGSDVVVKAMHWGPWEGGMVTPALHAIFVERGVHVLTHAEGARFFVDELAARRMAGAFGTTVEVVFGGALSPAIKTADEPSVAITRQHVNAKTHGYLADHAVQGVPVLPVVIALELMAEAAGALRPDLVVTALRDVKVLRGVRLASFTGAGTELEVAIVRGASEGGTVRAEIRGRDAAAPHYTATLDLASSALPPTAAPAVPSLEPYAVPRGGIYQDALFHGPRFHLIESIEGVAPRAMVARVRGVVATTWPKHPWRLDAAALDAGLQLVLLWARHAARGSFLPTGVGAVILHTPGALEGELRAILLADPPTASRVTADVFFVDASGRVVAEMRGVEAHRLPEDSSFVAGARESATRQLT